MYGDTSTIRALAAQLQARAEEIHAEAARLAARAEQVPWQGLAADAMRQHAQVRAAALRRTAALHAEAADALARHAREVDRLKHLIAQIERRARDLLDSVRDRLLPDALDGLVDRFVAPPPGSREWLHIDLPGLGR